MRLLLAVLGLLTWLALPIYLTQGALVRLRAQRLPPASGATGGRIAGRDGEYRVLVLGDSSAAAVGIERLEDGLAHQLGGALSRATGREVQFQTAGFNSATAAQLRDHVVPNLPEGAWSHVVLAIGVNDMKNFHTVRRWKADFGGLIYAVRARFPGASIVWTQLFPVTQVPAIPRPLADILEIRARLFNVAGDRLCRERGALSLPRLKNVAPTGFCRDGLHASELGYRAWADHICAAIAGDG